ncbi:MAG: IS3 family transposase [Acidimicrobiia bacterium]
MYSFIAEEQADPNGRWSVSEMCRVLEVSRSGFYDWGAHQPCERDVTDALLGEEIEAIVVCSNGTYGAPRVHAWLARQGYQVGRKRVARIMREKGFVGEMGRRKVRTTIADKTAVPSLDLLGRNFNPTAPDQAWCGDITYIATGEGWLFLATVIDLFSRKVIGWALAPHMRAELACDALRMAIASRGGNVRGVIFHSDRGSQYTAGEYRKLCSGNGIRQSMGATGICWDNAAAESFFASLKRELVNRYRWLHRADARLAIVRWVEGWYNARRLHSTLRYRTPNEAEADWRQQARAA